MKKKYYFSLLEVLLSLFFVSIVLTILFQYFSQVIIMDTKLQKAKNNIFSRQHLQVRLHYLFSHLIPPNHLNKNQKEPSFYTYFPNKSSNLHIHFFFDNGIDPNPAFSGIILGDVFFENNQLILQTYSSENKDLSRKEILLSNVLFCKFNFLSDGREKKLEPRLSAYEEWSQETSFLPLIIKLELTVRSSSNEKFAFTFFPPSEQASISYDKKKVKA